MFSIRTGLKSGLFGLGLWSGTSFLVTALCLAQAGAPFSSPLSTLCPQRPALQRFRTYTVRGGETLAQIAQSTGLLSATLMGINPEIRTGKVLPGQTLKIPPYNGIVVSLSSGQTLKSVAAMYRVRPDVLFEVNGCQKSPKTVFVPGVNWSPLGATAAADPLRPTPPSDQVSAELRQDRYPLTAVAEVKKFYGWQAQEKVVFSSGVDLSALPKMPVLSVAAGTVAFAGVQKPWGGLVVVNHAQGRQTRYGYLGAIKVQVGQTVQRGQVLGTTAASSSVLRFELRYRSSLGWVAQDPLPYLQAIAPKPSVSSQSSDPGKASQSADSP